MNALDCYVTRIISGPTKYTEDERCGWEVVVEYNCYGGLSQKTFYSTRKTQIEFIQPGSKFSE